MSNLVKNSKTKKERNRLSAKKCRLNRKHLFEQMQQRVQKLEQDNNVLMAENAKLKEIILSSETGYLLFDFDEVLV